MNILEAQYNWLVQKGTKLVRNEGVPFYIIAQYLTNLDLIIEGHTKHAKCGSIIVLEPNKKHSYYCKEELIHHWIHIEGKDFSNLLTHYNITKNTLYIPHYPNEFSQIFRQIQLCYHSLDPYRDEYLKIKIKEFVLRLAMQANFQNSTCNIGYDLIIRLRELRQNMFENPKLDWNIATMANHVFISESYLYQVYKKYFGITPNRDLINMRIERACILLIDQLPIKDVAEQCGYSNISHFCRQFKQVMGCSPNQYRKK